MKKMICALLFIQGGIVMAQKETMPTINGKKVQINTKINNGLNDTDAGEIQLGGALLKPTVLTTTSVNTLTVQGLQPGAGTDNVLVADANGVLKWMTRDQFGGDNLGNHTAMENLVMSAKDITGAGTVNTVNANVSAKTTTAKAQITKGTDGVAPVAGYVATAADPSGNVVWRVQPIRASYTTGNIKSGESKTITLTSNPKVANYTVVSYNSCYRTAIASFIASDDTLAFLGGQARDKLFQATIMDDSGTYQKLVAVGVIGCFDSGIEQFDFSIRKAGATVIITNNSKIDKEYNIRQNEM